MKDEQNAQSRASGRSVAGMVAGGHDRHTGGQGFAGQPVDPLQAAEQTWWGNGESGTTSRTDGLTHEECGQTARGVYSVAWINLSGGCDVRWDGSISQSRQPGPGFAG